ncbi:armadillo repeat-containing protein 4 [Eurytemora carolleeae]|uniref:armadillo repeat-containing protein 4 n=1 Tax=Eurytemora carolleeae TaxID=1294199 RepID=UPI000C7786A0|nr:armadillo repeat-containing protein 4 [Eurytemora carolleeae]|eukprot:XP_023341977.1 armadillo repeat-containing protein 4-like [Eurytemora affinis]
MQVARGGCYALWSLCKSKKNRLLIKRAGGFPLLAKLIKTKNISLLIPVIGSLQECAAEKSYCLAIQAEGMIQDFVSNMLNDNIELRKHCASAIFKCAQEEETRALVKSNNGLQPLVELIKDHSNHENKELMAAVTGALWKLSMSEDNVKTFQELELVPVLISLLKENAEGLDDLQFNLGKIQILTNIVGAIAESAKTPQNRENIRERGGLKPVIKLIASTSPGLLVNVASAIGRMAEDVETIEQTIQYPNPQPSGLDQIRNLDGVRLLWSLLKNPNESVQAAAAWALSPCIRNAENSGDMVRSFVGGLELVCGLLESKDQEVLAAVSFAIANIGKDKENLAVITDHGVIHKLARLAVTQDDRLRAKLAEAISHCCELESNRALFGKAGAVAPLVNYLTSSDLEVHRTTAAALHQLSKDPWNCVTMHQSGVVPHLLRLIGSEDEAVQEAAADCLQNIRKLALACEKFRYQHLKT